MTKNDKKKFISPKNLVTFKRWYYTTDEKR